MPGAPRPKYRSAALEAALARVGSVPSITTCTRAVRPAATSSPNPGGRSAVFLVPGLTAYLMAIGAVLLTALTVAGEWERGSMEQLFASPVGRVEVILGKLLPYLALGMLQLLLVVAAATAKFKRRLA